MLYGNSPERGQAFEPFNMLIGAVLALTILVIILSAVNYFEQKRAEVGQQKMDEGFMNAVRQPNGRPLVVKDIVLKKGFLFTPRGVAEKTGLPEECVSFDPSGVSGFSQGEGGTLEATSQLLVNIVTVCIPNQNADCEVGCTIGFESAA